MKKDILVSIITVCYNSSNTISDTIESVLNQTYDNIEYIIIDGLSQDNTLNIVNEFKPKFNGRIRLISEKDNGIYDAMNKGIKMAKGELIGILNSDDWYDKDTINEIVSIYKESKNKNLIISGWKNLYKANGELIGASDCEKPIEKNIYKQMPLNHPSTFVSQKVYLNVGLFDTSFKIAADYDFIYRCYKLGVEFKFSDKILSNMRLGGISDFGKSSHIIIEEKFKIRKKYYSVIYAYIMFIYDYTFLKLRLFKRVVIPSKYK